MRRIAGVLLCLLLVSCGGGTTGVSGEDNDGNQVAIGDGNRVGDDNRVTIEAIDETPPDLEEDIQPLSLSTDSYESAGSGCGSLVEKTLISSEYVDKTRELGEPIVLQDESKVRQNYYMDDLSNADSSRLPFIFVPGRKLRVQFYECGNAPIRNLVYVEALQSDN